MTQRSNHLPSMLGFRHYYGVNDALGQYAKRLIFDA